MRTPLSTTVGLLCLAFVAAVAAGQIGGGVSYWGPPRGGDVIVATVTKVSSRAATNAHPPEVELKVEEVLRGDPRVDRQFAVWDPDGFHWDMPGEDAFERWKIEPIEGPKVGERWILWGEVYADEGPAGFHVSSKGRFPFEEQERRRAIELIRKQEEARRAVEAEWEAKTRPLREQRAKWRAQASDADIRRYYEEADFVVMASIAAFNRQKVQVAFRVREILKGQERDFCEIVDGQRSRRSDDSFPLHVKFSKDTNAVLAKLWDGLPEDYLLFLSERGLQLEPWPYYQPINSGDGIVIADASAIRAVREAAKHTPAAPARPVLLLWSDLKDDPYAKFFEQAAGDKFTVVRAGWYQEGGFPLDGQDRKNFVPAGGNALVIHKKNQEWIDRGWKETTTYMAAVRLGKDKVQVVLEETFDPFDKNFEKLAAEAVRRLLDPKFSLPGK